MSSAAPPNDPSDTTPSSERTVYFDAPIMQVFSKDDSHDDGFVAPQPSRGRTSRNSLHYDYTGGQVRPRQSSYNAKDGVNEPQGPATLDGHDDVRAADYAPAPVGTTTTRRPQEATSDGTAEQSDSGYSSGSPRNRTRSVGQDSLKPVPVVWSTPPEELQDGGTPQQQPASWRRTQELSAAGGGSEGGQRMGMGEHRRSQSMRSLRPSVIDAHYDRESMLTTTPSGRRTPRRRVSQNNGSFANGAGTIGPNAAVKEEETSVFRSRSMHADAGLSKKQKSRIGKTECE